MKKATILLYTLLFCGIGLSSCGGEEQEEEVQTEEAVAVEAQVVEEQTLPQQVSYTGNIEAWEQAFITGPTGVRIDRILVDEGDRVSRGQLLVTMNSTQLNQAQTQLELARRQVERLDTLYRIGSVSGQQFDQAQTEYQNALSNYQNLAENTRLTANFSGVITEKHFTAGEVFSPSADAPAILTMMQLEPVKVTISVAENYFNRIREGMQATVRTDVYPDREFTGTVYRKSPTINRASRSFETEIRIENEERMLRPGMFARVNLDLGEIEGVYVPASAVINQPGTTNQYVFVKSGDRVERTPVETGNRYQDLVRILSGLEPGQTIITEGMAKLNEGSLVRVVNNTSQVSEQ
ncbi:efflux RND transporter periplasmic adaptor subunit [Pontibacter diazotrophicus]|nr:efflux RND transporter periplasmic adaptor subunit [Pontibacter diazotrophicus]